MLGYRRNHQRLHNNKRSSSHTSSHTSSHNSSIRIVPHNDYPNAADGDDEKPRPEALLDAMIKLQDKIGREHSVKDLTAKNKKAKALAFAGNES